VLPSEIAVELHHAVWEPRYNVKMKPRVVMKTLAALGLVLFVSALPNQALAQQRRRDEAAFVKERPAVGEVLPNVTVYDVDGQKVETAGLRGHYTVLTFGCLT
jgi:cytochrome oxidase Cu insertion factor (SCO1/SenC/PrrC family)